MGIVLLVIVAIPQLAPLAQAFMIATLIRVGVAAGPAVAATLAFRGLVLCLPLVLGLPFAWWIRRFGTRDHPGCASTRTASGTGGCIGPSTASSSTCAAIGRST
jgi:ABC-type sulfate transport system permease component